MLRYGHAPVVCRAVVATWRGAVVKQLQGGGTVLVNVAADKLPAEVRGAIGFIRVIDINVYQPNMTRDQVKAMKRVFRELGV